MKIGILGPAAPFRGGIAQFLHNMADGLSQENEVFVFSYIKQYPRLFFPGKKQIENTPKSHKYPIHRIITPYNPFSWRKAAEHIKKLDLEHLIIKFWIPFFCPAYTFVIDYLKKHSKVKIHILCHNLEFHERWLFSDILTKRMIKNADNLIVLSENVFESAKKFGHQNLNITKLFHPLYDVQLEKYDKKSSFKQLNIPEKPTVLFFGFIKHYKGLDVLLRAIPMVTKVLPDVQFIIAGEVYGTPKCSPHIHGGGRGGTSTDAFMLSDTSPSNIIFHSTYIPSEDIPHYFTIADIVVAPYRSATQSGIVQLAYSYLKPVIASDIAGLREMIEINKTGLLFENENHTDLAKKIIEYFKISKDIDFRSHITNHNEHYTWEAFINQIVPL